MFNLRIVRLQHRQRPDAPVEDIWRLLGTTNVPYEKRNLWEANDLRLGEGARIAADRMSELVTETPDRTASVSVVMVRENADFPIALSRERESLDLVWSDPAGRLIGRRFDRAIPGFRAVCRTDPEDPKAVRVAMIPEVQYGPEEMRWTRTEVGVTQRIGRAMFPLADMEAEVRLLPGRLLVLGARRTSDVSLGGALFHERRGPDVWAQTLILTVERAVPGQAPKGETMPFLVPPSKPGKSAPAAAVPAPGKVLPASPGAAIPPAGPTPATPAAPTGPRRILVPPPTPTPRP